MMKDDASLTEEIRFCSLCGYEGRDITCPVCNEKMQSLAEEAERISKVENHKSELFDDEVSLEQEQEKEEAQNGEEDPDL
jgi:hypothetical protein